jgi:3-oxoacyl-[acyl-carrier protein] reductase
MDLGLEGKVALVTASSRGLGYGCALALAREGARVVTCGRDERRLREAADTLPGETLAIPADVTDPASPARLVGEAVDHFGSIDIVVANAGGPPPGRALEVDDAALEAAFRANFLTSVRLAREAVPSMRAAGWGRICLIASSYIKQPAPNLVLSNTARTALWAWAKTAAQDLAPDGVTVNVVAPGLHATDRMRELGAAGPMGDPQDFGRVVAFLCSRSAGFVSGVALQVDGAATLGLL